MEKKNPRFSKDQWAFLAVFEALDCPVSIEMAGLLAPLLPGPLIQLITTTESLGWIEKVGNDQLALTENIPDTVKKKLVSLNSRQRLVTMVDRFGLEKWKDSVHPEALIRFLEKAGRQQQAGELEARLAHEAMACNDHEKGRTHFLRAASRLHATADKRECGTLFVESVLNLSNTSFAVGRQGFEEIENYLHKAQEVSRQLGDKRSHALINLHLGRLYYFTDRREEALVALSLGAEEIEDLGDHDIRSQSASFLGIYFFIKGQFEEAFDYLEVAERRFESSKGPIPDNPMIPLFFGYCAAYLGKFHLAIGSFDFVCRLSLERSDKALASTIRAMLGTILVLLGKTHEGSIHLEKALSEATVAKSVLGVYFSRGGIAVKYFIDGRIGKSYEQLKQALVEGSRAGLVRQFSSPWVLEMLYEYYRLGFDPIPDFHYPDIVQRIIEGVNIHLQGVAHRLSAKEALNSGDDPQFAVQKLIKSEACLRQSGDTLQLSKTLLEKARIALSKGNRPEARRIAKEAHYCLGGYYEEFFPLEFQHLLEGEEEDIIEKEPQRELLEKYLEMIESLYPSESQEEILAKVMNETCRMFGAERSGFFWFPVGRPAAQPELRALLNLSPKEVSSVRFKASLRLIRKVFRENTPIVNKITVHESALEKKFIRSVLCIPVEVRGRVRGVLYYDNSYLDDAFQFVDLSIAKRMARHTNLVVERRLHHLQVQHQADTLASEKSSHKDEGKTEVIIQSPRMVRLIDKADKIAETDSTVIILGETGTGKELLANRIYRRSRRSDGPFIVVDSTVIPDTLLESELFGHEKGAFTGADNRKIGCIEMAHGGTLFLDEVGELTWQAQSKLLRALQEKTIRRVGGLQTIVSDFRLIGATNRDLEREVADGRFREDLFFRLNVISLVLPPLREREEDAVELARHFLEYYVKKHNRHSFSLTAEHKEAIRNYAWPGNVRELKNIVERAVILSENDHIELDLPSGRSARSLDHFSDKPTLDEIQRRYIYYVLEQTGGKISGPGGALEILGMKRTSLYSRMKALGINRER